jgi:hypothetical protein
MAPLHHDLLVQVDAEVVMAVELLELATTWEELDYSGEAVIPPSEWLDFAAIHDWRDRDLAERLFSVAIDMVSRGSQPALVARARAAGGAGSRAWP